MKRLNEMAKRDNLAMMNLKLNEMAIFICNSDKGTLTLRLRKGGEGSDYRFVLDAVPVDDDVNERLLKLLGYKHDDQGTL